MDRPAPQSDHHAKAPEFSAAASRRTLQGSLALLAGALTLFALPVIVAIWSVGPAARPLWATHAIAIAVLAVCWRARGAAAGIVASMVLATLSAFGALPSPVPDGIQLRYLVLMLLALEVLVALGAGALARHAERESELRRLYQESLRAAEAARAALAERERAWSELVHEAADPIVFVDLDGIVRAFNPAAERLAGLTAGAVVGTHLFETGLIAPTSTGAALREVELLLAGAPRPPFALEIERANGERRMMEAHARLVWRDGRPVGFQAILRDVTERSELEDRLRESELRQRAVLDSLAAAVIYQTLDGQRSWNPAAEQLLRLAPPDRESSSPPSAVIAMVDADESPLADEEQPGWRALHLGAVVRDDLLGIAHADGTTTWVLANAYPIVAPGASRPHAVVSSFTDVTALRNAEAQRHASELRFRGAIEGALDAFHILSPIRDEQGTIVDYRIDELNSRAEQHLMLHRSEALGQPLSHFLPSFPDSVYFRWLGQLLASGEPMEEEIWDETPGFPPAWLSVQMIRLGDAVAISLRDVTERRRAAELLRQRERQLAAVTDNAPDAISRVDRQFRYLFVNAVAASLSGRAPEEIIGRTLWELSRDPAASHAWVAAIEQVFASGEKLEREWEYQALGGPRWMHSQLVPERGEHAEIESVLVISRDITERREAEDRLRESEERFRGALEAGLDAFHMMRALRDEAGAIVDFELVALNARAEERFGRTRDATIGRRMLVLFPETLESGVFARHCAVVETGVPIDDEYPDPIRGRGDRWIRVQSVRVGDGVAVTARDITARRELLAALAASEERLRGAIEAGLDAFIIITAVRDETGRVVDFRIDELNARAEERFGITRDTALGRRASEVSRVFYSSGIFDKDRHVVETGEPIDEEVLDHTPGRAGRWIRHQVVKLGDGVAITSRDITSQKQLETALRDSEARHRSVVAALEEGVLLQDATGAIVSCNASALAILGLRESELVGTTPGRDGWDVVREDGTPFPAELLPAMMTLRTGVPQTNVVLGVRRRSGSRCWLSVNARPVYQDGDTLPHAVVSSFSDITGRLQQERERRLLQELALAIAGAEDVRAALRATLRGVCAATGWEYGEALLVSADRGQLEPVAVWHTTERLWEFAEYSRTRVYVRGVGLPGHVWEVGEPVWSDDVVESPWFARTAHAQQAGLHSGLGVPVVVNGSLVAVLGFLSTQRHSRAATMLGPVIAVAAQLGSLIERKRAETALRESEELFRRVFDDAGIGMTLHAKDGRILQANPALVEMLGFSYGDLVAMDAGPIASEDDRPQVVGRFASLLAGEIDGYQVEKRLRHRDGHVVWGLLTMSLIRDAAGEPLYAIGQVQDISERKQREDALVHRAFHDPLTGLPNRALFEDRLDLALARARRRRSQVGVMYLDLDGFKQVNDTFGHDAGDRLLVEAGQRIATCLRAVDTVARLGGDEYTVLIEDVLDIMAVARVGDRVVRSLRQPFTIAGVDVTIGVSVGIAFTIDGTETVSELLKRADAALYEAKRRGRNRYVLARSAEPPVLTDASR